MVNLYKSTKFIYYAILSVSTALVLFLNFFVFEADGIFDNLIFLVLSIVFLLFSIFIAALLSEDIATRIYNKEVLILNEKCSVAEFIVSQQKHMDKKTTPDTRHLIMTNMAVGYIYSDNYEMGREIIMNINRELQNTVTRKPNIMRDFGVGNALASYHCRCNNFELMKFSIDNMEAIVNKGNCNEKMLAYFQPIIAKNKMIYNIGIGAFDGVEEFFNAEFENADMMLKKVGAKNCLANFYIKTNQPQKAREAYEFVSTYGNDTFMAKEAKIYLANAV